MERDICRRGCQAAEHSQASGALATHHPTSTLPACLLRLSSHNQYSRGMLDTFVQLAMLREPMSLSICNTLCLCRHSCTQHVDLLISDLSWQLLGHTHMESSQELRHWVWPSPSRADCCGCPQLIEQWPDYSKPGYKKTLSEMRAL